MSFKLSGSTMRKVSITCLALFLIVILSSFSRAAVYTSVSGTLVDINGQTWLNASYRIELIPAFGNPNAPLNQGTPVTGPFTGFTNGSGAFTATLDDNTIVTPSGSTWKFTVCPNAAVNNCSTSIQVVHGASMNLGASISADLQPIQVSSSPTIARAYQDSEVSGGQGALYWRTLDNTLRGCSGVCNGTNWVSIGSGGGSSVWGAITGLLSNQTDLQTALNAKASLSGSNFTGNIGLNGALSITNTSASPSTSALNFLVNGSGRGSIAFSGSDNSNIFFDVDGGIVFNPAIGSVQGVTYNNAGVLYSGASALFSTGVNCAFAPHSVCSAVYQQPIFLAGNVSGGTVIYAQDIAGSTTFGLPAASGTAQIFVATPGTSSSSCVTGVEAFDSGFVYKCIAANTWKRVAIATF